MVLMLSWLHARRCLCVHWLDMQIVGMIYHTDSYFGVQVVGGCMRIETGLVVDSDEARVKEVEAAHADVVVDHCAVVPGMVGEVRQTGRNYQGSSDYCLGCSVDSMAVRLDRCRLIQTRWMSASETLSQLPRQHVHERIVPHMALRNLLAFLHRVSSCGHHV